MELRASIVDITTLAVDAIVNAANPALAPGGGVCGSIFQAAGPALVGACATLGGCPTGEARATPAFRLPARHIVHAVAPRWQGGSSGEATLLASAYRSALALADALGCTSVAFPALGTGIYGYPLAPATMIAVRTVRDATPRHVALVHFACFSPAALAAYRAAGVVD